jgi:hypothetical protein
MTGFRALPLFLALCWLALVPAQAQTIAPAPPAKTQTQAVARPTLVPPPAKSGCYSFQGGAWTTVPCASAAYAKSHYPPMQLQYSVNSIAQPSGAAKGQTLPIVFGLVDLVFQTVGTATDNAFGANAFSIQTNPNVFTGNNGVVDGVQFTVQSKLGQPDGLCLWNINVATQNYTNVTCVPVVHARPGGIVVGDHPAVAGFVLGKGFLATVAVLPWSAGGTTTAWAVVAADAFGLAANWNGVSGAPLGFGNGSALTFSSADVQTELAASSCIGDFVPIGNFSLAASLCPGKPQFQPAANVTLVGPGAPPSGIGTLETNNLGLPPTPTLTWINADLVTTTYVSTTPPPPAPTGCFVWSVACGNEITLACDPPAQGVLMSVAGRIAGQTPPAPWTPGGLANPSSPNTVYDAPSQPAFNQFRACAVNSAAQQCVFPVAYSPFTEAQPAGGCPGQPPPPPLPTPSQCRQEGCAVKPSGGCLCQ